ncbi:hypothetical protein BV25DRAFT_1922385 [Artomyces pyxidatus]|uniref:Uncharacterized protein n=1 Tax=Artomyces pyxidatus TaxID=48021 RepID=A0ACB8SFU8_9AGAM|nr:hypothetical protein BV25DRAFT_1922385 [Artomyces pyxidatus]
MSSDNKSTSTTSIHAARKAAANGPAAASAEARQATRTAKTTGNGMNPPPPPEARCRTRSTTQRPLPRDPTPPPQEEPSPVPLDEQTPVPGPAPEGDDDDDDVDMNPADESTPVASPQLRTTVIPEFTSVNPFAALSNTTPRPTTTRPSSTPHTERTPATTVPQAAPSLDALHSGLDSSIHAPSNESSSARLPPLNLFPPSSQPPAPNVASDAGMTPPPDEYRMSPSPVPSAAEAPVPANTGPPPTAITAQMRVRNRARATATAPSRSNRGAPTRATAMDFTEGPYEPIHDPYPDSIVADIELYQVNAWRRFTGRGVLVRPFDIDAAKSQNLVAATDDIRRVIHAITGTSTAKVTYPNPQITAPPNTQPLTFMVRDLTPEECDLLLARLVWSSPTITFRTIPLEPQIPKLLFTVGGLAGTATCDEVLDMFRDAWSTPSAGQQFDSLTHPSSQDLPDDPTSPTSLTPTPPPTTAELLTVLHSASVTCVQVKTLGDKPAHRFNVVAETRTLAHEDHWWMLVDTLQSIEYKCPLNGTAVIMPHVYCSLCHAIDHPRGLCKYPLLRGWNGGGLRYAPPGESSRYRGPNGRFAGNSGPPTREDRQRREACREERRENERRFEEFYA